MGKFKKDDEGKLRYDLIPHESLEQLVKVYNFGATKYGDKNWEEGTNWMRIFAAIQRHLWAWRAGEDVDPESNINHLAHAAWGCFALLAYTFRKKGNDDRGE